MYYTQLQLLSPEKEKGPADLTVKLIHYYLYLPAIQCALT